MKSPIRMILAVGIGRHFNGRLEACPTPMNDRARATEILRKARAILAERLTEKILEQRNELLDDAQGDSYMNEIESLYEQVGMKLSHVGQMLSNLPPDEPAAQTHTAAAQHSDENTFTVATEA